MLGALTQQVNTYGQPPLNTTSQGSVIGQQTESHPSDLDSTARSNAHNLRSTGSKDTPRRIISERRSRDPRKYRSRLFGRKTDVRGDDGPVRKRARLESALREDSRANYQGEVSLCEIAVAYSVLNKFYGLCFHFVCFHRHFSILQF